MGAGGRGGVADRAIAELGVWRLAGARPLLQLAGVYCWMAMAMAMVMVMAMAMVMVMVMVMAMGMVISDVPDSSSSDWAAQPSQTPQCQTVGAGGTA